MGSAPVITRQQYQRGWLRLVRLPNLLTVCGDPLAGICLASLTDPELHLLQQTGPMLPAAGACLCLYMAGLILNDLHDVGMDRILRPDRPLPSRTVPILHAMLAVLLLTVLGMVLICCISFSAMAMGLVLVCLILTYTFVAKPVGGLTAAVAMGLCRGVSTLVAVDLFNWNLPVLLFAACVTAYTTGLTLVSEKEDRAARIGWEAWMTAFMLFAQGGVFAIVLFMQPDANLYLACILLSSLALLAAISLATHMAHTVTTGISSPEETRFAVARFIHIMPLVQSWPLLLLPVTVAGGLALVLASGVAMWANRRYPGS